MLTISKASIPIIIAVPGQRRPEPLLTDRERVVLALVVDGLTNPSIAERLANSPRTVQSHVRSLMREFGVTTRTEPAVHAPRRQIVPLGHPDEIAALPA